jgi:hypothetical protein
MLSYKVNTDIHAPVQYSSDCMTGFKFLQVLINDVEAMNPQIAPMCN